MREIKKHVESMLWKYSGMKRELKVLEFEMENLTKPLSRESVENGIFAHSIGEWGSASSYSDRTATIATEHVDRQRGAKYYALKSLICTMRLETTRLEHYLSLLPTKEAEVIRWFYIDGLSWPEITPKGSVSLKTLQRRRKQGLDELTKYYAVAEAVACGGSQLQVRFISYIHEERYMRCLAQWEKYLTPGTQALLYIICGCNELWDAGPDTFFDFEQEKMISQESIPEDYSPGTAILLRLAYCYATGVEMNQAQLLHILRSYFTGLEHVYLELAIEALGIVLFSDDYK